MIKIFVSLLGANILELKDEIKKLEPYCDGFHLDVMDMHFVPNLAFSPVMVNELAHIITKEIFVHLMVKNPEQLLDIFQLPAHTLVAVHRSSTPNIHELIAQIKDKDWSASIALAPYEPIDHALSSIDQLTQVLIMSVEPGFAGQQFIPDMLEKARMLREYRIQHKKEFRIAMDGGINETNILDVIAAGVDDIAVSSAIFSKKDPVQALQKLQKLCKKERD